MLSVENVNSLDSCGGRGSEVFGELVFENVANIAFSINLDFQAVSIVNFVVDAGSSSNCFGGPVEGEFSTNCVPFRSLVEVVEEELSHLNAVLVNGLVLESNKVVVSWFPDCSCIVGRELASIHVIHELGSELVSLAALIGEDSLSNLLLDIVSLLELQLIVGIVDSYLGAGLLISWLNKSVKVEISFQAFYSSLFLKLLKISYIPPRHRT